MGIAISKLFAQLLFWLYDFLDAIFQTFQVLVGIQPVDINGDSMSLINVFLTHSTVTQVFLSIFLLSIILVAICTVAKVVGTIVNVKGGERKSHAKTVGQAFGSIITSLVMAVVLIMFIFVSNSMLQFVQKSFNSNYDNLTFSQMLFDMSVETSYRYDYDNPRYEPTPILDEAGKKVPVIDKATGEPAEDENGQPIYEMQRDENGNIIYEAVYEILVDEEGKPLTFSGWQVKGVSGDDNIYYSASDLDFSEMNPDIIFGIHKKTLGLFEDESKPYTRKAMVELDSFNLWTAYLVVVIMLVVIIWSMLGLVKRIFDLTFLLLALPLISATIPLDDGAKFKTWRDTVISKIVLAFGIIFSINIFLLMLPIIQSVDFVALGWSATIATVFKIFLMLGGALAINGGQLLAARLVGADASESREMTQSARALLGGVMAAGGLARGAKNLAVGGQNKYGRKVGGILPTAGKVGGGAANVAGNVLGGAAYRSGANRVKGVASNVANALRGMTKTTMPDKSGGAYRTGGQGSPETGKKQGLFHNGIIGGIKTGAERHKAKNSGNQLSSTDKTTPLATPPNVINQQSNGAQNYEKPNSNTSVDDMVSKMGIMPKEGESGAMKKPPKK